jgi:DNA-3-methyladenine glycosylase II
MASASEDELVAVGFSRRKAEYVVGVARGNVDYDGLRDLEDDEIRARLTTIRGLGPWTAEWFLARHLARPRAWPAGDLALRKAADVFYGLDVHELGRRLDPFQNLSAHYLLSGMRLAAAA